MDAEFEFEETITEVEVLDGQLVQTGHGHPLDRVRSIVASPRVQAAAAATTGFVVGAATLTLLRRSAVARGGRQLAPLGPNQAGWPAGPTVGPIRPGTYLVTVRAVAPRLPPR